MFTRLLAWRNGNHLFISVHNRVVFLEEGNF